MFWINTGLGTLLAAALVLSTPLIVALYGEPSLAGIIPFAAAALLSGGLQAQQQIHLARSLRFNTAALTEIGAQLIATGLAISLAWSGYGVWALAWQIAAAPVALFVLRFAAARFVPKAPRRGAATQPLIRAGLHVGGAQLLNFAALNASTVMIGNRWGAAPLGQYGRAANLTNMPTQAVVGPLTNVAIPTLNRLRREGRDVNSALLNIHTLITLLGVTMFTAAASSAPWLIPLVLGQDWAPAVGIFQALSAGGAVSFAATCCFWGFLLNDATRSLLISDLIAKPISVVLVFAGVLHSVEAAAIAHSAGIAVSWLTNLLMLARLNSFPSLQSFLVGVRLIAAGALGVLSVTVLHSELQRLPAAGAVTAAVLVSLSIMMLAITITPGGFKLIRGAWRSAAMLRK
ncbi:lipopolysaccharide biosynthesis protein [Arenivirga flava]|uniref:Lipopolysaccharide biosynthesis protein n=1 Tax=Arenivirga flava TaxID=1930060 RepID=A0AA37UCK8_9MICO|nr:lipopolysaccharide biosynthesis protein [Arenivirga flava]